MCCRYLFLVGIPKKMSEVNIGRRKEKCENCSKQVSESLPVQPVLLSSCLSCEGCLSEEESQRISQQNLQEVKRVLSLNKQCDASKHKVLVVSVCPQSLPFFAVKFCLGIPEATQKLCGFLKSLGVHHVFDTTLAAGFSILESQREFVQRYRRRHHDSHALPMFTSSCPGNTHAVMGSLVKDFFTRQQKLTPDKVFHVVVAPCFDKKLEAVREEFYNSLLDSRDVDCVLTSGEIFQMMQEKKVNVDDLDSVPLDHVFGETDDAGLVRHEGRGSEGLLEHVFKNAAKELFGLEVDEIVYKTLRNRDFQEVSLERDGETLLQFAAVYGFRNIQTLVHRMRKGRVPYQLVEVLSCPGGCLSGRGQVDSEGGRVDRALTQQMEEAYSSLPVRLPEMNPEIQRLYQDWLEGQDSPRALQALHTHGEDTDHFPLSQGSQYSTLVHFPLSQASQYSTLVHFPLSQASQYSTLVHFPLSQGSHLQLL
ncbi:hypothetical protein JZ751_026719 [Albula glossodonta]|uniref:Iron hydrogenase small subunit domain-containing protein n=1 Tax=Albula glossodonta TaxID=121402 RepID=A0A8T2PCT6_9TELE|nr:hypothetical protein JZ751_026719 [Albula glossodonta]